MLHRCASNRQPRGEGTDAEVICSAAEGEAGAAPAAAGDGAAPSEPQGASNPAPATAAAATTAVDEAEPMDEDALLQQALAMSMTADEPTPADDGADGGANGSAPHMEQVC